MDCRQSSCIQLFCSVAVSLVLANGIHRAHDPVLHLVTHGRSQSAATSILREVGEEEEKLYFNGQDYEGLHSSPS